MYCESDLHLMIFFFQPNGFNIEITNTNPSVVMVGVRILVGCQSVEKAPSFVEIFGRVIQLTLTRNRWFDLPFTREESLTADKKFSLFSKYFHKFVALAEAYYKGSAGNVRSKGGGNENWEQETTFRVLE